MRENLRLKKEKRTENFQLNRKKKENEGEENEFILKKMELDIEAKRIESTTGERVKSSLDVHHLIQKFDPEVGYISLCRTLFERQVKREKISEEFWVSHLIGLLPNDMAQLIVREPEEVTEDYEYLNKFYCNDINCLPKCLVRCSLNTRRMLTELGKIPCMSLERISKNGLKD
ncbi:hypothetical protein AVEN_39342-1 [Araneus ventricosus]|uniref:Uncharacterized protein n=1 Tax=Araneus ventricosus TaxID=182803 RepID=A0A4Y2UTP5_ARAVE|nr:hypothetical protein AVEN_39342-1 [Araneus ventricosus]